MQDNDLPSQTDNGRAQPRAQVLEDNPKTKTLTVRAPSNYGASTYAGAADCDATRARFSAYREEQQA